MNFLRRGFQKLSSDRQTDRHDQNYHATSRAVKTLWVYFTRLKVDELCIHMYVGISVQGLGEPPAGSSSASIRRVPFNKHERRGNSAPRLVTVFSTVCQC